MTNQETKKSQLDSLISPEIKNDELYYLIEEIASSAKIKNILEKIFIGGDLPQLE